MNPPTPPHLAQRPAPPAVLLWCVPPTPCLALQVDDDVYLRLDRLPVAAAQWAHAGVDYVGCFKTGGIVKSPQWRW